MKISFKYLAFLLLISLSACETSKFPIDDPANVKVDTRFMGHWKAKRDRKTTYIISQLNDYHYQIITKKKRKDPEIEQAYLSSVEGNLFLNVYNKDSLQDGYLLLRIMDVNAKADRVAIATISDTTMKHMSSAAEVRQDIIKNINNPAFYDDTIYLHKVKK
ncbi:MAG: hypothetical protein WCG87_01575 [Bacteroidota bacterium]